MIGAPRVRGAVLPVAALVVGLALVGCCMVWSLGVGQREIAPGAVVSALLDYDRLVADDVVVVKIRLPRTLLAILVGVALAVAGALVQSLTRNPLAEPGILGVNYGASFAIVLGTWWGIGQGRSGQLLTAVIGAGVATVIVYVVGRVDPLRLVLAGMAMSALLGGLSLGIRLLDSTAFDNYRYWSVGSLAGRDQQPLLLPCLVIAAALVVSVLLLRPLGAVALGDEVAHGLGVPVGVVRTAVLGVATVLAGVSTAIAGPIAFAGLIVPHAVRPLARGSVAWLVVLSAAFGPVLLIAADTVGRLLLPTGDVPVAIVTGVLGGAVLIWVVRRHEVEAPR